MSLFSKYKNNFISLINKSAKILLFVCKAAIVPLTLFLVLGFIYHLYFLNKIYPGVKIAGTDFSGNTRQEAQTKLKQIPNLTKITLQENDYLYNLDLQKLNFNYDLDSTTDEAFKVGRRGGILSGVKQQFLSATKTQNIPLQYKIDQEKLDQEINTIDTQLSIPATEPTIVINNGNIVVDKGRNGKELDKKALQEAIDNNLSLSVSSPIIIPVKKLDSELTDQEVEQLKEIAKKIIGKQILLTFENQTFTLTDKDIINLLDPNFINSSLVGKEKTETAVKNIATGINRPPQDALFVFADGRVKEFKPSKDGIEVNEKQLVEQIFLAANSLINSQQSQTVEIPTINTKSAITNEEVNNLGIKELIGVGESYYKGSITSRIHNLSLATTRFNGILIKPGEEFSFNKALGDISVYTGYEQAYVIKDGKTVLGDGGGVCQVSTTFFRAALNAGLPIVERHAHSYRVSYYELGAKPGIDATVYSPAPDLRIKNDTPGHILIQTRNDTATGHLTFELYGTSDGRIATITTPRLWDFVKPPPPLYQDDPTLPNGTVKQVEHEITGVKAAFDYKVMRGTEILQDRTFTSNYRAWQAVYLRGTGGI